MTTLTRKPQLDGLAQQLAEISNQLTVIFDAAMDLETSAGWYDVPDPQWGGPPTKKSLIALASRLRQAYIDISAIMGLDPCEQFEKLR